MSNPFQIHCGDALDVLKGLDAESVDTCITSPPYFNLRSYQTPDQIWGGDMDCVHHWGETIPGSNRGGSGTPTNKNGHGEGYARDQERGNWCGACGAWRGSLGLEPTPDLYIEHLVLVFNEVRRILKPAGTLWVTVGDSYAGSWGNQGRKESRGTQRQINGPMIQNLEPYPVKKSNTGKIPKGSKIKPKDLYGIPWMLSFALRDSGWWLRQWMPWIKWNGMCESTKDRPTSSCESIFLLSKSATYLYDYEAVKKPVAPDTPSRYGRGRSDDAKYADGGPRSQTITRTFDHMLAKQDGHGRRHAGFNDRKFSQEAPETRARRNSDWFKESLHGMLSDEDGDPITFVVNTLPTKEAHFAAFPITLVEPMILAGCPEGGTCLDPFSGLATVGLAALRHGRNYIGIELSQKYVDLSYERARRIYPLLMEGVA